MILQDLKHKTNLFYGECSAPLLLRILLTDGTSAMFLFRIVGFFRVIGLGFVAGFFLKMNGILNGCIIGRNSLFGEGFVIMHSHGIVINGAVRGGKNIVVESGVVIGATRYGLPVKAPTLGNDIFIGAGAKIIGGITIGNGVTIGANAVVVENVPDGATVVGIPGRVVKMAAATSTPPPRSGPLPS
jgi:serine O-acetyltransferase